MSAGTEVTDIILVAHPADETELPEMIRAIRREIESECRKEETPYMISVGIGYDELRWEEDTFQLFQEQTDEKLYLAKKTVKAQL